MLRRMRFLLMLFSLCLSLTITGCGLQDLFGNKKASPTKSNETQKPIISVALNEDDPNKILILKGIEDMAKKEEAKIQYLTQAGEGKADSSAKQETKSNQKSGNQTNGKSSDSDPLKGGKVLIYQGGDPSLLKSAQDKKIPILALGFMPTGTKSEGIVLADQEKTGELMAQTLISKLSEGQVVILEGDPENSNSQEMLAGIRLVLGKYPKVTIQMISSPQGSESVAKQTFSDYLQKNLSKVQAVLAQTEKLAALAYEVLKEAKLEKKIILIGGQANIQSMQRMASGTQLGDIDTAPYLQGVNAYQWAQKLLKKESLDVNDSVTSDQGETPAKVIPVKAVNSENLNIVQKNYIKAISMAEQEKQKEKEASKSEDKKESGDSKQGEEGQKDKETESNKSSDSSGGGGESKSGASSIPSGVSKITERVKTETTREYHDSQGKVIGTEKSANEQIKTIPPEMLKQEGQNDQKSTQQEDKKEQKSDEKEQQEK
ncbi:MAG: sugar ABC transporter substrate-binding protein [Desulfitobacteriaceae bacterium]